MGQDRDCAYCGKEIEDHAMKAKDRFYHESTCFKCQVCYKDLRNSPVFSKENVLYCENDYKEKFVPKCAKCNEYIMEVSYSQCGNFMILPSLRFYVKSIFGILEVQNLPF